MSLRNVLYGMALVAIHISVGAKTMLQKCGSRLGTITCAFVLFSCPCGVQAQSTVHLYRYEIQVHSGDLEYRNIIAAGVNPTGHYYKVETDSKDRIIRTTSMRSARELGVTEYHYNGSEKLPYRAETFINGEETGIHLIQRSASGIIARWDNQTVQGVLTAYMIIKDMGDHTDKLTYDSSDKYIIHETDYFAPSGALTKYIKYPSPTSETAYTEVQVEEHTGLLESTKQFKNGELDILTKYTYSADGDILRRDGYNGKDNSWFVGDEYTDGRRSRRLYKYSDGDSREVRFTYDEKQRNSKSELYHSEKLICTLSYDRQPDGTVKRTLATGPDGTLWAEYPAPIVFDIDKNGEPVGRSDGILHKTGDWW